MESRLRIYGILVKQYMLKHRWWIIFLMIAAVAAGAAGRKDADGENSYRGITAGVCWADEKGRELLERLEAEDGIFQFQGFSDRDEMVRAVENGSLECGYELPENFYEELLEGKAKGQVKLYYSPASSAHKISYEIVFVNLFEMLSQDILREYRKECAQDFPVEKGYEVGEADMERLLYLNRQYVEGGSTFHFVYETTNEKSGKEPETLSPLRGCMAVMIFFMCLLGLGNCLEQERIWQGLQGPWGRRLKSGYLHVAVFGSVAAGGLCVLLQGLFGRQISIGKEIMAFLAYAIVLELYVRILNLFIKSSRVLYGLLPALMVGSCLFSPVFVRMENYLPALGWISKIFPATYYLEMFF